MTLATNIQSCEWELLKEIQGQRSKFKSQGGEMHLSGIEIPIDLHGRPLVVRATEGRHTDQRRDVEANMFETGTVQRHMLTHTNNELK